MNDLGLDRGAILDADRAFVDSQVAGETKAQSVRRAIKAYLDALEAPAWPDIYQPKNEISDRWSPR